jgi:hypothetical protein
LNNGWLKPHQTSREEIQKLYQIIERDLPKKNHRATAGLVPAVAEGFVVVGVGRQSWLRRGKPCGGLVCILFLFEEKSLLLDT